MGSFQVLGEVDLNESQGKVPSSSGLDILGEVDLPEEKPKTYLPEVNKAVASVPKPDSPLNYAVPGNDVTGAVTGFFPEKAPRNGPRAQLPATSPLEAVKATLEATPPQSETPLLPGAATEVSAAQHLATPGKRWQGATEAVQGAGEAVTPFMGPAAAEMAAVPELAPALKFATGLGVGIGGQPLAEKGAEKLGASPEQQKFWGELAFWAPQMAGLLASQVKGGVDITPEGTRAAISTPGGKVGAGVAVTPESVTIRGKVGPLEGSKTFQRGGGQQPGQIEAPTIEGQPPAAQPGPPPPSDDPAITSMANAHAANETAAKQAAGIPEPPPPTILDQPNAPPELKENRIAPESITRMASFVAGLPDAQRAQAVQEAHQTLTAALTEMGKKGPVSMPDGTLALVKDLKSAEKLAISIINDAVKAHDKVSASVSGEGERGKQTGAVSPKEAASGDIFDQAAQTPTATEKASPAAQEAQQPLKKGDTATLARDIDINGKTLAKGTQVEIQYAHPNGLLVRAVAEDGTKISRGVGAFTKGVESKNGKQPTAPQVPVAQAVQTAAKEVPNASGPAATSVPDRPNRTASGSGVGELPELSKQAKEPKVVTEPEHPNLDLGEHAKHTEMVPTKTVSEYGKDVEMLSVDELSKFQTHDRRKEPWGSDMDELKADVQKNGIKEPLLIGYNHGEKKAVLWDGNHRLGIAKELKVSELPVKVIVNDFPTANYGKSVSGYEGEGKVPSALRPSQIGITGRAVKTEAQAPKEPAPSEHHASPQPTTPDQNSAYHAPPGLALPHHAPEGNQSVAQPEKTEEKPKYKFGNTQANIPAESEASKSLESARARISETDLAGKGKDIGDGGNHVTVRYGIKGEDTEGIRKFLSEQAPFEATLGKTESFPPSEHSDGAAVIQAPIESPELHRLNAELEKHGEFTEPSFKEYKPHATVAYVKPDKVSRYVGMDVTHGKKFTVDEIAISKKDGSQEVVKLEGKKAPAKKESSSMPAVVESGREKILESEIKRLQDEAATVSAQFSLKSLTGYDPFSPLRKQYNDLLGQARAKEDELAKLRGEPTRAEKREAAKIAAEKKFADRPEKAMKYGDIGQSQHWQVQEPDYIDKRFTQEIARYKRAIPEQEARIKELGPKVSKQKRDIEESTLHFWKKILADTEARDPRKAQKFKEEYRKLVKEAVSHGSPVPQEVIGQLPEFKLAQDARERYEKGLHTSFANRSAAINDTMQKEEGFKVKRQDGKPITEAQMKEISTGVDEMVKVLGPELREMMRGTDLTISHTSGKHPFLSDAGGQYHPLDRSISAGINNFLGKPIKALAHETGHWLDFESGRVLNTKALIRPKSGGPSTETKYVSEADRSTKPLYELARQTMADTYRVRKLIKTTKLSDLPEAEREEIEVMKVVLGPYWHEPRELWARMFEQYVGTKFGRAGISMRSPEQYQSAPAYWPKEAWAKIEPLFEEALKTRMDAMRERYAPTTIKGESAAAPTPPPSAPETPKPAVAVSGTTQPTLIAKPKSKMNEKELGEQFIKEMTESLDKGGLPAESHKGKPSPALSNKIAKADQIKLPDDEYKALKAKYGKGDKFEREYYRAALEKVQTEWDKLPKPEVAYGKPATYQGRKEIRVSLADQPGTYLTLRQSGNTLDGWDIEYRGYASGTAKSGSGAMLSVSQTLGRKLPLQQAKEVAASRLQTGNLYDKDTTYTNPMRHPNGTQFNGQPIEDAKPVHPRGFSKDQIYVKIPGDGHFLVNNNPAAIARAIDRIDEGFAGLVRDKANPMRVPKSPADFNAEKYISGLEKEVAELEDDLTKALPNQKVYLAEQLKAARENLSEAKKPESILAGESGELDISKLGEAVSNFYEQDIAKALEKAGTGLKAVPSLFVRAFYPRIEESNPIGRALGVAAPADAVDSLMKVQGDRAKALAEFDLVLKGVEKMFDRLPDEARIDFIDRIQTGTKQANSNLDDLAEAFTKVMDAQREQEQEAANLGREGKKQIELTKKANYFHNWWDTRPGKEPEEEEGDRVSRLFTPKRPLEGTKGYNRRQSYTIKSGIEAGGEPVTTNPVRILRHRIEDGMKFVTARRAWNETKELGLRSYVRKGAKRPAGFDKIDDKIAKVYFPAALEFPGMEEPMKVAHEIGEWYVESNTARLLNNMLSVDKIRRNPVGRGLMWLKNASTALELGLSPFHAVFESIEAMSSMLSLGMQRAYNQGIRQGKPAELAQGIREMIASPAAPITLAREGAALPAYIEARARLGKIGLTEFGHVISGEQPHGVLEALKQFQEVRKEKAVQRLIQQYPDLDQLVDDMFQGGLVIGQHRDYQVKAFGKTAAEAFSEGNPIGAVWRAIPTLTQGVMYPLFNWYIPNLKYSLFLKMMSEAASEHARELDGGELTRATLARRVADSVENRFGELNFDNLFLNRTTKTALQFLFRSMTYKLGTVREFSGAGGGQLRELGTWAKDAAGLLGGGGGGKGGGKGPEGSGTEEEPEPGKTFGEKALPRLDSRAAWVTSLMIVTAMLGTIAAKLLTKKYPWQWISDDEKEGMNAESAMLLEVTHPRTGELDSRGKPVRISLPTYWKDVEHAAAHPAQYVLSSLSGIVSKLIDTAENKDYFGNYVYNPSAPLGTKLKQAGKYNFPTPFVVSSFARGQAQNQTKTAWLSAFGFPKAPSDLDFTPAEKAAQKIIKEHEAPATPEELEAWREKRQAFTEGKLPLSQARGFMKRARESMLQRQLKNSAVSYSDARRVYELANPDEKKSLDHIMYEKRSRLLREHRGGEIKAAESSIR